jgi:hypothetical protein
MDRLGTELQQEGGHAQHEVRIAVEGELLAVQVGLAVGDGIDQAAALELQLLGIGLPVSSETFIRKASVPVTPIG